MKREKKTVDNDPGGPVGAVLAEKWPDKDTCVRKVRLGAGSFEFRAFRRAHKEIGQVPYACPVRFEGQEEWFGQMETGRIEMPETEDNAERLRLFRERTEKMYNEVYAIIFDSFPEAKMGRKEYGRVLLVLS